MAKGWASSEMRRPMHFNKVPGEGHIGQVVL